MRFRTLLLTAALAWAAPLAAQDVPRAPTLLRVTASADGTVLALDSAAIARGGDSVFTAEGRADPASTRILWATSPTFAVAAAWVPPRSRWRPARVNGQPVAAWTVLPMAFRATQP